MLKVNQVLLVLTLFVAGSLGRSPPGEGMELVFKVLAQTAADAVFDTVIF